LGAATEGATSDGKKKAKGRQEVDQETLHQEEGSQEAVGQEEKRQEALQQKALHEEARDQAPANGNSTGPTCLLARPFGMHVGDRSRSRLKTDVAHFVRESPDPALCVGLLTSHILETTMKTGWPAHSRTASRFVFFTSIGLASAATPTYLFRRRITILTQLYRRPSALNANILIHTSCSLNSEP
jgi:hypothetical protein